MREEFLEQIAAVDLQVEVFELAQAAVLRLGEIPGSTAFMRWLTIWNVSNTSTA